MVFLCKSFQTFQAVTPKIIIFEVGTTLYLLDSIPQINIVNIAVLKAHNACELLDQSLYVIVWPFRY